MGRHREQGGPVLLDPPPAGATEAAVTHAPVPIADKVAFLSRPESYPHAPHGVSVRETHMSWLFLTGSLVFKLKKPVVYPFLDFSTLEARRRNCAAELRLNRRLAGAVYRRLVPLRRLPAGALTLTGTGEIVDWLVEMAQLSETDMLDSRIRAGRLSRADVAAVGDVLSRFYRAAEPLGAEGALYGAHIDRESLINRQVLLRPELGLATPETRALLDRIEALLASTRPQVEARIASGAIVEGHGDLRPEHVCVRHDPVIIDCLEFDRTMRILDPYDEVNYLGLECAMLGAPWIGPMLVRALDDSLSHPIGGRLLHAYGAFRAALRARLSLAHLLDPAPTRIAHWQAKAGAYLARAGEECLMAAD